MGAEVDHGLIHADAADDGVALAVDEDVGLIGEGAEVAVAITDGEGDDAGVVGGGPGGAVADGVAGLDDFEEGDAGFEGEGGGDGEGLGALGGGVDAVEEDAGADEVEVGVGKLQDGAGVGDVAGGGGEAVLVVEGEEFEEAFELETGVGEVAGGGVGVGEVGVDAFDAGVAAGEAGGEEFFGGVPVHADALHAGVDFEVDAGGSAEGGGGFVDEAEFFDGGGGEGELVLEEEGDLFFADAAEDEDGGGDAGVAEGDAFFEEGDAEAVGAVLHEVMGDGEEAVAVGVGLDDGHDLGAVDVGADGGEVAGEGVEADFDAGGAQRVVEGGGVVVGGVQLTGRGGDKSAVRATGEFEGDSGWVQASGLHHGGSACWGFGLGLEAGGVVDEGPGEAEAGFEIGGEGFDAEGLGGVVAAVEDVEAEFLGEGVAPVGAFAGEEGVDAGFGGGGDFGAGAAGGDADAAGGFGATGADVDGAAGEGGVELGGEGFEGDFSFGDEADGGAFELEETAGGSQVEGAGDAGVVAEGGVDVEGQVGAVEGEAVFEAKADFFVEGAGDGLEAGPEEAVVDEEEIGTGGGGFADDGEGGVDGGGDVGDGDAGGVDLEAVQGGRVVGDVADVEFGVEMGDEIGEEHG